MVCCLMAPSHYLNQCWLLNSEVLWHSHGSNFKANGQPTSLNNKVEIILYHCHISQRPTWVNHIHISAAPSSYEYDDIGSGNGLVLSGNKSLPDTMFTQINNAINLTMWPCDPIWHHRTWSTLAQVMAFCPDGTSSLPEPRLTNHQWGLVAFTWGQFHMKFSTYGKICILHGMKITYLWSEPHLPVASELKIPTKCHITSLGHNELIPCFPQVWWDSDQRSCPQIACTAPDDLTRLHHI